MTDTDTSSTPVDEPMVLKESKKNRKKHKKKYRRDDTTDASADVDDDGNCHHEEKVQSGKRVSQDSEGDANEISVNDDDPTRGEKRKKKKKDKNKKRKRSQEEEDGPSSGDDNGDKRSKKKHKKKKSRKSSKDKERNKHSTKKEIDEKVVSSSAIEYYPEDLKHLQLKKNQETVLESNPGTVESSKLRSKPSNCNHKSDKESTNSSNTKLTDNANTKNITLLLFYQYVEPPWDESQFQTALQFVTNQGQHHGLTGRMRVAHEGLNCTLTGTPTGIRGWCSALRTFDGGRSRVVDGKTVTEFANTEFKLTDDLPPKQRFPKLHAFEVVELVNYGLAGSRAPTIAKHGGTHLEPHEYHKKMCEKDTVIIDVRNHYEANIGRFDPPKEGAQMIDPKMRKSTEFPVWLDKKETKEMLRGKQVLMYCTGGVRCERASALLKQKIDQEEDTSKLGIKGVYQLQGGVDKYFKAYPTGGLWKGKNYTFDKRFAHAPAAIEAVERTKKILGEDEGAGTSGKESKANYNPGSAAEEIMGKCEACQKPWDMYRGKRRCPTCGVPSLICRECFEADKAGTKKLGREVRCDLCVTEDVRNKRQLREREEREVKEYEQKLRQKMNNGYELPVQKKHVITRKPKPNPERITRLFLKNMCARQTDEAKLLEILHPARATHIQWLTDRNTGKFYGSAFIEVSTAEDAGSVLALDGMFVLGRRIKVKYQRADEKDIWPIPNTEILAAI